MSADLVYRQHELVASESCVLIFENVCAFFSKYTGLNGIIFISTYAFLLNFEVLSKKSGIRRATKTD
jgi:hypothetical protein